MPENAGRYKWVAVAAKVWAITSLVVLVIMLAISVARAIVAIQELPTDQWVAALPPILSELVAIALVAMVYGLAMVLIDNQRGVQSATERIRRLESVLEALHESSRRLVTLSQMSDAAKSLLYRQREAEAIDEVLHDHLIRQDYASAEALVRDIETRLGHAEQVPRMRKAIAAARETTIEQKVHAAMKRIDEFIGTQEWDKAVRLARRLMQLLPKNAKVAALPQRLRDAQTRYKRDLLQAYGEAVKNGDIDRSIDLLNELDKYLTPAEAAALAESARGVFRTRLHNFGVQFAIRVTEENWAEAVAIGEQIVQEYPNSRMAQEVRQKMTTLRALAGQPPAE